MSSYTDNPLDQEVNTELMRVCKCVIPYLDRGVQKNVAIGLKFLELVNTINAYSDPLHISDQLSLTRQGGWEQDLLRSVRSNLSSEKAYIIDAIIKLQEFRSLMNTKESASHHAEPFAEEESIPSFFDTLTAPSHTPSSSFERPTSGNEKSNTNSSPAQVLQALSPLLDDNQKQLLTLLSTFMNK